MGNNGLTLLFQRLLSLIIVMLITPFIRGQPTSFGVVGDSAATGAVTDPQLQISLSALAGRALEFLLAPQLDTEPSVEVIPNAEFFGIEASSLFPPPLRLLNYPHEIVDRPHKRIFEDFGNMKLDVEEYSFGFLVAKRLGISNDRIVITARNGAEVGDLYEQFDRLQYWTQVRRKIAWTPGLKSLNRFTQRLFWTHEEPRLPDIILVSFTGNDFCSLGNLQRSEGELRNEYARTLTEGLQRVTREMSPAPNGTDIYIIGAFDLLQSAWNEELLRTEVPFQSRTVTCKRIRTEDLPVRFGPIVASEDNLLSFLSSSCKALFRAEQTPATRAAIQRLYNEVLDAQQTAAQTLSRTSPDGFRFHYLAGPSQIRFTRGDLANDCFHPSARGQAKIAVEVLKELGVVE